MGQQEGWAVKQAATKVVVMVAGKVVAMEV